MKLAVSNIAWPAEADSTALESLSAGGIQGIEVAPTRVWPEWRGIDTQAVREFRHSVNACGLAVSSLQAILFQKPELQLFGSDADRQAMYQHLCFCADLAAGLGAECLVFGAPKNRTRGQRSEEEVLPIAVEFFSKVAGYYAAAGVCLGLEPNPPEYGCDFVTRSQTAAQLVRAVGSEGFRLHLDTACLQLAGEDAAPVIESNRDILRHFHASEPFLGPFSSPVASHAGAAQALREMRYHGWVALEMRAADPPLPLLQEATRYVRKIYGDGN